MGSQCNRILGSPVTDTGIYLPRGPSGIRSRLRTLPIHGAHGLPSEGRLTFTGRIRASITPVGCWGDDLMTATMADVKDSLSPNLSPTVNSLGLPAAALTAFLQPKQVGFREFQPPAHLVSPPKENLRAPCLPNAFSNQSHSLDTDHMVL